MSWINSNATYKQNSKNDLSFYHGFSKTPVEPTSTGTAATTLANASTKGGHTVIGTEVWAEEIPWFGLVASRAAAVTRLSGLTKLNDLVKVDGEGGKVYKYKGADDATFTEETWADFWQEVTLTNGMTLNNRHNQPVLRYYLNQPMQTLTTTNNASIDSKGFATRLFVNEENHTGQTSGGSVVSQFAAGTDNIKNGIPSVELNPKLYLGTTEKIAGTHYYDYNVSGTILWSTAVTSSSPKISCFRYIGKTVTSQLSTIDSTVKTHSNEISEIKDKLGLGETDTPGTPTLGGRVTDNEAALRVLLGLEGDAKVVATESIATTATTAASNAVTTGLAAGGAIATAIETAKQEAISSAEVTITAGTGISIEGEGTGTTFEISVDETVATAQSVTDLTTRVEANKDAIAALTTGDASVAKQIETALTTAKDYTNTEVGKVTARLTGEGDIAQAIAAADSKGQQGITDAAAAKAAADAAQSTANTAKATANTAVQTVTGDTYVKATKSGTTVTLETQVSALDAALAAEGTTLANAIAAAKSAGEGAGATAQAAAEAAQAAAEGAQSTADTAVAAAATAQGAAEAAQSTADQAVKDAAAAKTAGETAAAGALSAAQAAQAAADAAQATANQGVTDAAAAQSTANTAVANAAAAQGTADDAKATADTAVQSASGDTYVSAAKEEGTTNIKVTTNISAIDTELVKTTSAVGAAVKAASDAAAQALTDAKKYTDDEIDKVEKSITDALDAHTKDIQEVTAAIESLSTSGFERIIVSELPTEGIKLNAIYLVPLATAEKDENVYAEYIYVGGSVTDGVVGGGTFEQIGTTKTDLAEYAKTADVTSAIATAKSEAIADATGKVEALAGEVAANKTAAEKAISDLKDGSDKTIATLATEIAAAQGDVDALETVVSALSQTHASDKAALEASIAAVSAKIGDDSVATQIDDAIKALDVTEHGSNGIKLSQTDGKVAITVTPDTTVKEDSTNVVTSGAVAAAVATATSTAGAAVAAVQELAQGAQNTANTAVANAATAQGAADAAQEAADAAAEAAEAAQTTADSKIAAVEVTTDAATHLGAHHISATTDTDKKVTVAVSCSDEWEYTGTALTTVASVINGKMSDGKTIDDANLTSAEGMFMNNESLTTYVGSLGKLTNGENMFKGCTGLTTFVADLASLTDGTGMFEGCALTEESLIYIVDSLPDVSVAATPAVEIPTPETNPDGYIDYTITVGVADGVDKAPYVTEAAAKGWTLV